MRVQYQQPHRLLMQLCLLTPFRIFFYFERTAPECGNHYAQCGCASIATESRVKRGGQGGVLPVPPLFPSCSKYTHDCTPLSLSYVDSDDSDSYGRFIGHFVYCYKQVPQYDTLVFYVMNNHGALQTGQRDDTKLMKQLISCILLYL